MNDTYNNIRRSCIDCAVTSCNGKGGMYPDFCPTAGLDKDFIDEAVKLYTEDE